MCSIYLINVGANTSHSSQARSPIFDDGSFVFVSFCTEKREDNPVAYPKKMLPFTRPHKQSFRTHNDPDWCNMTYGDICSGPGSARGAALKNVIPGDTLLFWGLLWCNKCLDFKSCVSPEDSCWNAFTGDKGWYLLGAMRVKKIVKDGREFDGLSPEDRCRVKKNAHFVGNRIPTNHWIFLGDKQHSRLFDKAVALWVPKSDPQKDWESSLMYKNSRAATGQCLSLNGNPRWSSSLRSSQRMWDLGRREERVRDAIRADNPDFDLLQDTRC